MASASIAILGGTGALGSALARRLAATGHPIIIGSRVAERAEAAAREVNAAIKAELAQGAENALAALRGDIVLLAIPFSGMAETLAPLAEALTGKTVVSTIVPLDFADGRPQPLFVPEGSAAQRAQRLLPRAHVIAAFHHLSAITLARLQDAVDADVLVCGDDAEAKRTVLALANELPGARGIDAGPLDSAGPIEAFTVALLRINRRYRAHTSVRITHLPARKLED